MYDFITWYIACAVMIVLAGFILWVMDICFPCVICDPELFSEVDDDY